LLEVIDLLVLAKQLAFVSLNIVKQHCFLSVTASLLSQRLLELRQQLVFGLIQVFDQGSQPLNLGVCILQFLLFGLEVFLSLAQLIHQSLVLVSLHLEAVAKVDYSQLSLVFGIYIFDAFILTIV
jgi:hypothetical protein